MSGSVSGRASIRHRDHLRREWIRTQRASPRSVTDQALYGHNFESGRVRTYSRPAPPSVFIATDDVLIGRTPLARFLPIHLFQSPLCSATSSMAAGRSLSARLARSSRWGADPLTHPYPLPRPARLGDGPDPLAQDSVAFVPTPGRSHASRRSFSLERVGVIHRFNRFQ